MLSWITNHQMQKSIMQMWTATNTVTEFTEAPSEPSSEFTVTEQPSSEPEPRATFTRRKSNSLCGASWNSRCLLV